MDFARARELCRSIDDLLDGELLPLIYDDAWDGMGDPPFRADVTEEDADRIIDAQTDFGLVTIEPFTTYTVIDSAPQVPREGQWIDPESGKVTGYIPNKLMTHGLAQAQKHLLAVEDAPHDLRRLVEETLDLIHEALVALDYTPESPLLKLAAEDG